MGRSFAPVTGLVFDQIAETKSLYSVLSRSDPIIPGGFFLAARPRRPAYCSWRPCHLRFTLGVSGFGSETLCQVDGDESDQEDEHGNDVSDGSLARTGELGENPDGEGLLLARGKGSDDDLVKGEGKGKHAASQ